MSKILYITAFVPSNIGAGVNYSKSLIEDLSKKHEVHLIAFKNSEEKSYIPINENIKILKTFRISTFKKLLNVLIIPILFPLFTAKFNLMVLFYLKKILSNNNYDFLYFDFSQMFLYSKFIKHNRKILMSHDIITQRYSRISNKFYLKFCYWTEKWILSTPNSNIFTFSKKDSDILLNQMGIKSTPTTFYLSNETINSYPQIIDNYFVFFAMWKRDDNYKGLKWFIDKVIPHLSNQVKFKIIGSGLNESIKSQISNYNNIEYLGFVDNPYPIISNSIALISPLFTGAGVKVKVIDSLSCGTPIIGTTLSFEGIDSMYDSFMISANSPEQFINRINNINISLEQRIQFKKNFVSNYSNKSIIEFINRQNAKLNY